MVAIEAEEIIEAVEEIIEAVEVTVNRILHLIILVNWEVKLIKY